ncbi:MAG: heme-copper oxidase subunit III [Solirubrobacteraceae bacterium]|nr:heme-copper oxidase subunit III [Solirubrobacteraceae bacterium]
MEAAAIPATTTHDDHHHGPPEANNSSGVHREVLGILLFIISEIMLFGAFFAAYFFIRVVSADQWPPGEGLPVYIALTNAAILLSSSMTMHWTDLSAKRGNQFGMRAGIVTTFLLGLTFLFVQVNEYIHIGFSPSTSASASIFFGLTGLHGAHVIVGLLLLFVAGVRIFKGRFNENNYRGLEVPGIYWHFVDVMWIVVFTTIYLL